MMRIGLFGWVLFCYGNMATAGDLRILPDHILLDGPNATQQLLVVDTENGQVIADQTKLAQFQIAQGSIAKIQANLLQALQDGDTTLSATVQGKTATAKVQVRQSKDTTPPNFRNEVIPILTKTGCNSGACHGALAGKGGLKLSLRGYDPETDFFVLTRQALSRRVNQQEPSKSLILQKATRELPHGGGTRFEDDTKEYQILFDWIRGGCSEPKEHDPQLTRIEVFPSSALLKPKDSLQVLVRAYYQNGQSKDVTRWSRFGSSEELVANVTDSGLATVAGHGEAAITIGFGTQVTTMTITSPFPQTMPKDVYRKSPKHNFIDDLILQKLELLHLPPSEQCSDAEFIRRFYLDAMGILPTLDELKKFVQDTTKDKRAKLIDAVLERPEFVDYWSYKWSDLFLVSTRKLPQPAMWAFYRSIRQAVADNKPWDQFAKDLLTSTGSTFHQGGGNFFVLHKDVAELSESTAVTFLGMSINCARCHNHPLEKWTQDQYWSMANLFSRVALKNGDRVGEVLVQAQTDGDVLHPRRKLAMPPTPLDGKPMELVSPQDRRRYFANWLTAPDNPYFSKAIVNRVWKNFMGRGLVEAEDDLRETNPPSNKELLDALAKEFQKHKYDMKHLMRLIANSAAYQRSSRPMKENLADDRFYSRYILRRLSGEVILDLMSQVTESPTLFNQVYTGVEGGMAATNNYPVGTRALQLPDSRVASRFLDSFGRPDRVATCSCERQQDSTVGQALMLNNGQILNDKLRAKNSRVERWLQEKKSVQDAIEELFLVALCRQPTTKELETCQALFKDLPKDNLTARREALEDLFWAVITNREFIFNH